jgi:hypothetical protein
LYDGNYNTAYGVTANAAWHFPITIEVALNKKCLITGFDIGELHHLWHPGYSKRFVNKVSFSYAVDGGDWQPLVSNHTINWQQSMSLASGTDEGGGYGTAPKIAPIYLDEAVIADKVKLVIPLPPNFAEPNDGFRISEFVIRGTEYPASSLELGVTQHWGAITNLSEGIQSGKFIMALYSINNELKDIAIRDFDLASGKSDTYTSSVFSKTVLSDDYVKVFAFEDMNSIKPLAPNKDSRESSLD